MPRFHASIAIITLLSLLFSVSIHEISGEPLTEEVRVKERDKRYSREWPPTKFTPDTVGWTKLTLERLRQVAEIDDLERRYEGYMQAVMTGLVLRNFTEFGFGLARGPEQLSTDLRDAIRGGLERGEARFEVEVEVIEGPRCLFIDRPDLTKRVRYSLKYSGAAPTLCWRLKFTVRACSTPTPCRSWMSFKPIQKHGLVFL
jgi:hypothetical protein